MNPLCEFNDFTEKDQAFFVKFLPVKAPENVSKSLRRESQE